MKLAAGLVPLDGERGPIRIGLSAKACVGVEGGEHLAFPPQVAMLDRPAEAERLDLCAQAGYVLQIGLGGRGDAKPRCALASTRPSLASWVSASRKEWAEPP